ncbi:putative RNA-binding Zn ribbon-like protein [Tahibacter aquaticus]|uniref:Putative RNA-binding Zn ribbon-like protein n=1 Tax=Tahibacter aquaticus TaxID=520092 RepID=A0A4V3DLB2_9GAMM|nr:CGNR zinc finger domain-containing protein [Tahibacter aquaticus]TDR38699.1 putative RNA-binding Zn ribbon-like protein [Tahibacter aquaticus]
MRIEPHVFRAADLVAGDLALDLVNSVTARDSAPRDWLADYDALLQWAHQTGHFAANDLARLERLALAHPRKAKAALERLKRLREALCAVMYALVHEAEPAAADLRLIENLHAAAAQAARLARHGDGLALQWQAQTSQLDLIAHVVCARALPLLQQLELPRLRICDGHDCGWVFLDTSKSGRRRWCDMATCGNSAKAQRFLHRQQAPRRRSGTA